MTCTAEEKAQRVYARLAGLLFLLVFVTAIAGHFVIPAGIVVPGDFSATSQNMTKSEQTYRLALAARLVSNLLTIVLAGALYALLAPVSRTVARFALLFRAAEAVLGSIGVIFVFIALSVYTGAGNGFGADERQSLVKLFWRGDGALYDTGIIFFSIGSTLFFLLLFKSRFIPRILSLFGIIGSILVAPLGFAGMLAIKLPPAAEYVAWGAVAVGELGGGLWLLIAGANLKRWRSNARVAPAALEERP